MKHVPENRQAPGLTYFISSTLAERRKLFAEPARAEIVIRVWDFYRHSGHIELYGFVVMPDHVHLIVRPRGDLTVSRWTNSFKSAVAHEFRDRHIWQRGFWSEVVADEYYLRQKLDYMHRNPVNAGLVAEPVDYAYSSARDYYLDEQSARIDRYR